MFMTTVIKCHSLSYEKLKKAPSFIGWHYIKLSCGWFWHWLSWSHYNILMTNSISATVVEVTKYIQDTMSKPTTW